MSLFPWATPNGSLRNCNFNIYIIFVVSNNWIIWFSITKFSNHNFHIQGNSLTKYAYSQGCTFKNFITSFKMTLVKKLLLTDILAAAWNRAVCLLHPVFQPLKTQNILSHFGAYYFVLTVSDKVYSVRSVKSKLLSIRYEVKFYNSTLNLWYGEAE